MMKEHLEQKLNELRADYETIQNKISDLEDQLATQHEQLWIVTGAIQALEEALAEM